MTSDQNHEQPNCVSSCFLGHAAASDEFSQIFDLGMAEGKAFQGQRGIAVEGQHGSRDAGFNAQLQALLEVQSELSKTSDLDELCEAAVALAVARLGFERLGIWFCDAEPGVLRGSFGVDEEGILRDERACRMQLTDDEDMRRVLNHEVKFVLRSPVTLCDANGKAIGQGMHVMAPLWDGEDVVGIICADNRLTLRKISENQCRLLALFAVLVGHLCSLHRRAAALQHGQEEYRQLEAEMQHAQKLESLGVLAGGIAHDFNNLLVAMLGNVELAQIELDSASPVQRYLRDIATAATHGADLCRQMLAYSGKGRLVQELVDLNDLAREMAGLIGVAISKNTRVEFRLTDMLPFVEGDATQLRQVVMNLVTNASEALGGQPGVVAIETGVVDWARVDTEMIQAGENMRPGEYVYLEVADTGCGMQPDTLKHIFDPFYSTKFADRGLGLAAVLGIVRRHHGGLRVDSVPGKGSSFRVLLPPKRAVVPEAATREVRVEAAGSGKVLIIDDEPQVRELGAAMLGMAGYGVLLAPDGESGLALLEKHVGAIDVVLLDMAMPAMNGRETFDRIRKIDPSVPVLLCSGYDPDSSTEQFPGGELAGFLAKPFRMSELLSAVKAAVGTQEAD